MFQIINTLYESPIKDFNLDRKVCERFSLLLQNGNRILSVGLSVTLKRLSGIIFSNLENRKFLMVSYHGVGETERCTHLRFSEHQDLRKNSEPAKHLKASNDHWFTWKILAIAPRDNVRRKTLEAFYIAKYKPSLNDQLKSRKLKLFHHGVT